MLTHSQHTVCRNTHSDWRTFHPTIPPVFHSSRVNIIYGVESRFFHPDPQMKELILCFLSHSLTHSPSHQLSSHLSDSHLDRGMQLFPFSTFSSEREEQAAAAGVIPAQNSLIIKGESSDWLHSFWPMTGH